MDELTLPEDLSTMTDEELTALLTQAVAGFDELYDADDASPEAVQRLGRLAEQVEQLRGEDARRDVERAEAAEQRTTLAERVHGSDTPAEGELVEDGEEEDEPVEPAPVEGEDEGEADQLAAAGRRPGLASVRRRAPVVQVPARPDVVITAATDIPGIVANSRLGDNVSVSRAMHERARVLSDHSGYVPVATIQKDIPAEHTLRDGMSPTDVEAVLASARNPQSLVAAGGWCAPSSTIYDLFGIEGVDGIIDLPTVRVDRGGLRWPTSPSIADAFEASWLWTEQNDIDAATAGGPDPTKPCFRIPCPAFVEDRLDAYGICITHGNLADRAFPELTTRFTALVLAAHAHEMNRRLILDVVAGSTAVVMPSNPSGGQQGAAAPLLGAVELQATDYRLKYRMPDTALLEGVFPHWVSGAVRSDLAKRTGVDLLSVSNAQIREWFADRLVVPQFVQDWQQGTTGLPGGSVAATGWPTTVDFLLYAAGTFVNGDGGTIDLGVVRDSALNATNDFTAAWTEEFHLIAKMGHESRLVTVPICPDGATAATVDFTCPTA